VAAVLILVFASLAVTVFPIASIGASVVAVIWLFAQ
jgi:hypothetical protein